MQSKSHPRSLRSYGKRSGRHPVRSPRHGENQRRTPSAVSAPMRQICSSRSTFSSRPICSNSSSSLPFKHYRRSNGVLSKLRYSASTFLQTTCWRNRRAMFILRHFSTLTYSRPWVTSTRKRFRLRLAGPPLIRLETTEPTSNAILKYCRTLCASFSPRSKQPRLPTFQPSPSPKFAQRVATA